MQRHSHVGGGTGPPQAPQAPPRPSSDAQLTLVHDDIEDDFSNVGERFPELAPHGRRPLAVNA
jgi:hypothetical protein